MSRLTEGVNYCAMHCDFGKRGKCFFKDKSKCYEKSMFDKLKAYEENDRLKAECEKQTPKKVIYHGGNYDCPVCGNPSMAVSARKKDYCDFCGQKLDWSKEKEV